jgi:inositol phosphorylceramide mannosyltransferase catalytic subunit
MNRFPILPHLSWGLWLAALYGAARFALISSPYVPVQSPPIIAVSFDDSMRCAQFPALLYRGNNRQVYHLFKELYQKNGPHTDPPIRGTIPKIIHQIWLGSPVPEQFVPFIKTWQTMHPQWEYCLWDDAALAALPLQNKALYEASTNYGERSDIARYEILNIFGGLYVDIDYEAIQALDPIHERYDFYIGIQPLDVHLVHLGTGLIGATPGHPLVRAAIEGIAQQDTRQIISRTGPIYFSRIFIYTAHAYQHVCAFPASYFYPRGYTESIDQRDQWQKKESYAVHHWAGSWTAQEATVGSSL